MDTKIIDLARERRRRGPRFTGGLMDILEVSRDLVCLCRGGKITAINGAGIRLLGGTTTEDLLGRRLTDFLIPETASVMALFLAGKASADKAVPTRLKGMDGRLREVEMQVYRAREIAADATVIVGRDLSHESNEPVPHQDSESRVTMLLDNLACLVCHVVDGTIRYINRTGAAMIGADCIDSVVGMAAADLFPGLDAATTAMTVLKRLDGDMVEAAFSVTRLPAGELLIEARPQRSEAPAV